MVPTILVRNSICDCASFLRFSDKIICKGIRSSWRYSHFVIEKLLKVSSCSMLYKKPYLMFFVVIWRKRQIVSTSYLAFDKK